MPTTKDHRQAVLWEFFETPVSDIPGLITRTIRGTPEDLTDIIDSANLDKVTRRGVERHNAVVRSIGEHAVFIEPEILTKLLITAGTTDLMTPAAQRLLDSIRAGDTNPGDWDAVEVVGEQGNVFAQGIVGLCAAGE
ncbi:MAG TPA: hypothetical protein VMR28_01995 [Candidatus Saccharimonadales bacterium]|nr:hypothetical protein [Candidatus Saccharimonadales bacterium]